MQLSHVNRTPDIGALARQNSLIAASDVYPFATIWVVAIEGFSVNGSGAGVGYLQLHATDGSTGNEPAAGAVPQFQMQIPEGQSFAYRPPTARRMVPRVYGGPGDVLPNCLVWAISADPNTYVQQANGLMVVEVEYVIGSVLPYTPSP